ncbi:MAG: ABC transporter substrate-binding protein [Actinobacteria bacterium]|nr:ABC transporter substrate-binding protein [Actinomycetota bacterium]
MKKRLMIPALIAATLLLAGCTNSETATPDAANAAPAAEFRSWAEIEESGVLQVGTITDYPPNETKTADGKPTGWAVELVGEIASELGLNVEYQELLFDSILPRIEGGAIDLGVGSFTDTVERQQVVDFVNYYSAGSLWAAAAGGSIDPDNACGLTVAVMKDGTQHLDELPTRSKECVDAGKPAINILPFTGQPEVTTAVVQGQADAFSADSPVTIEAVDALGGEIEIVGEMFDTAPYGLPVAKGSELAEHVRAALQTIIDDGRYLELLKKYHSESGAITEATINIAAE